MTEKYENVKMCIKCGLSNICIYETKICDEKDFKFYDITEALPYEARKDVAETKYYKMEACFEACRDDDVPFNLEVNFNVDKKYTLKDIRENCKISFSYIEINSHKWQIKRAAQKILSANQIIKQFYTGPDGNYCKTEMYECARRSIENGQVREYYRPEQVELREALLDFLSRWKYAEPGVISANRLYKAVENLKPPTEE